MVGFFLINKPTGITSHDVIYRLRRISSEKRIGHAGTLDPAAEGLLIVAVGREATRGIDRFAKLNKEYVATIELGKTSSTYDREGEFVNVSNDQPSQNDVEVALQGFVGGYQQVPPAFSAKKIAGKKAYELARLGKSVDLVAQSVEISELELLGYDYPVLKIRTVVSKGTYIRSLAHDIGEKLSVGAYLLALTRTKIGKYNLSDALLIDDIVREADLESARIDAPTK